MSLIPTARGRRGTAAAAATSVVLAVGGVFAVAGALSPTSAGPPQPASTTTVPPSTRPAPPSAQAGVLSVATLPRSRPVALEIPSLGIDSSRLVDLGTRPDGTLEVPRDEDQAGWYAPGPAPGQLGPAVLAGHVDGDDGPGIFYRLGQLQPGAMVHVTRADATTATFAVYAVERYPKDRFPTIAVYGDTTHRPELRLITCGGQFDEATGHYRDNVVVFAHQI